MAELREAVAFLEDGEELRLEMLDGGRSDA